MERRRTWWTGRFRAYASRALWGDLRAGATVAVLAIPQGMAFALIAGVPPIYGLYGVIVPVFILSFLGGSRFLMAGPTNAVSIVLAANLASWTGFESPGHKMLVLTFLVGAFQVAFGIARLGEIVRYVSRSVVMGFTVGAGILIAVRQLDEFMGITLASGGTGRFLPLLVENARHLGEANLAAIGVGAGTIVLIIALERIHPNMPGPLAAVGLSAAAASVFHLPVRILRDLGHVEAGLPVFHSLRIPIDQFEDLLGPALALAVLGLVQAVSVAKAIEVSSGGEERLDASREFIAQGTANVVGSLFGALTSSGSFSRSSACYRAGAVTRLAGVWSAALIAIVVLVFGGFADLVPLPSLAGVLFLVSFRMVNRESLLLSLRATRGSTAVLAGTLAATLFLRLEYAVYVGILLSIGFFLRLTSSPVIRRCIPSADGDFREQPLEARAPSGPIALYNVEGSIYFGAVPSLERELRKIAAGDDRVVILRMRGVRTMGSTGAEAIQRFHRSLAERGARLILCGADDALARVLRRTGIIFLLGEENVIPATHVVFESTRRALARAEALVAGAGEGATGGDPA
ncbi:MAG: SulP family inorganic anion transporter [Planctomycetes bacterium]|nr:SulP family inorganic anion transporter [Planctomycetota bacterium]